MIAEKMIDDLRCVFCGEGTLTPNNRKEELLQCVSCSTVYESVCGVPFLGQFEEDDLLGLIEISANIPNRGKFGVNPKTVENWEKVLSEYHQAVDKVDFVRQTPEAQSPYFGNRYGEWVEVVHLIQEFNLDGLKVLDIGAGLGFDSHRLSMHGAKVTALEFSPILSEAGKLNFPHIRWIGGFSHCLPFKSASFDAVFCNAALHHMKDIPAAISESLRVLRPGGKLITTCDSFRPSDSSDDYELKIFDKNPTVLLGVNEGVPKFSDFVSILQQHSEIIKAEVFTHTLYNGPFKKNLTELIPWNLDRDGKMLSKCSGSLALRVTLNEAWPLPAKLQKEAVISAKNYASSLSSESSALTKLAPLMPEHYVDLPLSGGLKMKFELLNGWRLPKKFQHARTAYRRGRWFLKKTPDAEILTFDLKLPTGSTEESASINVSLNGQKTGSYIVDSSNWTRVSISIEGISINQVYAIEIQMQGGAETFDKASFMVRNRSYTKKKIYKTLSQYDDNELVVYAVIPVFNRIHFTLACIKDLKAQTYQNIKIIVSDGGSTDGTVDEIHRRFEDVVVLTSKTELWWTGAMAAGIEHALRETGDKNGFVLMMNNDTQISDKYVASLVAASQTYDAAVGSVVVDSRNPSCILDAGEYIDWNAYSFPVNINIDPDEQFRDDVDVLPGRGSLVPLEMIRIAGNVDAKMLPHYLADYEFFYRLKQNGFRLGVHCETRLMAHIEETGIIPGSTVTSFRSVFRELFSRRSMTNVLDHWRFVKKHAPKNRRVQVQCRLIMRAIGVFLLRTRLRPLALPFFWLFRTPIIVVLGIKSQYHQFIHFFRELKQRRMDILCHPVYFPSLISIPLYLLVSPGPFNRSDCTRHGLDMDDLTARGIFRSLEAKDWCALEILDYSKIPESEKIKKLFWEAWNPFRKIKLLVNLIQKF